MATWKKIITSGSAAELSSLTLDTALPVAQGGTGATTLTADGVLFGNGTSAISAVDLSSNGHIVVGGSAPAAVDGDNLAGGGLAATKGNGTLVLAVEAAQTGITSILATDLKIGEDDETKIDFEDDNKINFYANNNKEVELAENSLSPGSSDGTALGTTSLMWSDLFLANGGVINFNNGNASITHAAGRLTVSGHLAGTVISGSTISASAFVGDGSGLTGVGTDIDSLDALGGTGVAQSDKFIFSDGGTEKSITFSNLEDAIFGNVSGEATIAGGGALTIAADVIGNNELKQDEAITLQSLTLSGNLTVNGTTTTITSTNVAVSDKFMFLASGSTATDGGIIVGHDAANSGSAFGYDVSEERWAFQSGSGAEGMNALEPDAYAVAAVTDDNTAAYRKNGNIRVQGGEIFIYVE